MTSVLPRGLPPSRIRFRPALPVGSQRPAAGIGAQEVGCDLTELDGRKGLPHNVVRPLNVVRACAEDDDRQARSLGVRTQLIDQLGAVHHRHHHVGDQEIDALFSEARKRSRTVVRLQHLVAGQLQDQAHDSAQIWFVIDDQYASHVLVTEPPRLGAVGGG